MKCLNKPCFGCSHFLPTGKEGSEDFGGVIVTSTCFSHKALYVPYSPLLATTYSSSVSRKNHVIPTKILHYPLPPSGDDQSLNPWTPISNVSFSLLSTINFLECKLVFFVILITYLVNTQYYGKKIVLFWPAHEKKVEDMIFASELQITKPQKRSGFDEIWARASQILVGR